MRIFITLVFAAVLAFSAANGAIIDEFNDGSQVWSGSGSISSLTESGGTLNATKNGGDPFVSRTDFTSGVGNTFGSFESDANPYVHMRITVFLGQSRHRFQRHAEQQRPYAGAGYHADLRVRSCLERADVDAKQHQHRG